MRALPYDHVEVRPGTLPRTSRVVQAGSRSAQWPRESPGTIMGVGKTLKRRTEVLMVTWIVDVSGQHSGDVGQTEIPDFRIDPI